MCTRFSVTYQLEAAARRFKFGDPGAYGPHWFPRYNIAPTDEAPVVVAESSGERPRELRFMIFGLIPHWAKEAKIGLSCLNARAETVAEKPAFREAFLKRRCLVLADGFYEWKKEGKVRIPYRVVLKSKEPFGLAGLWDEWRSPQGKAVQSFSIITSEPNSLVAPIHNRMPVILTPETEDQWINPAITNPRSLLDLLKPLAGEKLDLYRVSLRVNSPSCKDSSCLDPIP